MKVVLGRARRSRSLRSKEYAWVALDEALRMEDVEPYTKNAIRELIKKYGPPDRLSEAVTEGAEGPRG